MKGQMILLVVGEKGGGFQFYATCLRQIMQPFMSNVAYWPYPCGWVAGFLDLDGNRLQVREGR